jgi:hypothetical protein
MSRLSVSTLSLILVLSSVPVSAQLAEIPSTATVALNESYAISRQVEGRERISYLVRLTRAGTNLDPAPRNQLQWCNELFNVASTSPIAWDRVANQKNAAQNLAIADPTHAMDLLASVDAPQPLEGIFPEDVRAHAAAVIFPAFWRAYGLAGLAQIQQQARRIGETGEYPYRAMGATIGNLLAVNQDQARSQAITIFREAINYYNRHSKFENKNEEFLELLSIGPRLGAPDAYRAGLEAFVNQVSAAKEEDGAFAAEVRTATGVVRLNDQRKLLLWRVFPLVAGFDPAWAHDLIKLYPELAQAQNGVELLGAHQIYGDPPIQAIQLRQQQMLEQASLPRIASASTVDPQAALQTARNLTTTAARIPAIASVLPSLLASQPDEAKQPYNQLLHDLQGLTNSNDRLHLLVPVAKSAYYVQDLETFDTLTDEILNTGESLFQKDIKRNRADLRLGYREMGEIVEFATAHNINWVLYKVERIQDPLLKAHLLIFVAQGFNQAEHAVSPPTSLKTASK